MRRFLVGLIILLTSPALAQNIDVRTGDHLEFTRVVFTIPPGTGWTVARSKDGYDVSFDTELNIDVSGFFERIQPDRVGTIAFANDPTTLSLRLACDCFAEAYLWRADRLVVDIKDEGTAKTEAFDSVQHVFEDERIEVSVEEVAELATDLPEAVAPQLGLGLTERQPLARNQNLPSPLRDLQEQQVRVSVFESKIAESLERAVSQGLLESSQTLETVELDQTPAASTDAGDDLSKLLADINSLFSPGVAARTSVDDALLSAADSSDELPPTNTCYPDEYGDIATWATDSPFQYQIGQLRSAITGEFDRTDPEAVEALAKAYLFFGFGREAISTLSIDGESSQFRQFLVTVGEIIDGDPLTSDRLSGQVGCDGAIAIWGFLAHDVGPLAAQVDAEEIVVAFKRLPTGLRKHLASRLASKLNRMGEHDLAENVLSIAVEDPDAPSDVVVTASEIAKDRGKIQEATALLDDLADDDPRMTPNALLELIALKFENDEPVEAEEIILLQTLRFESRDSTIVEALIEVEIAAHIQRSEFGIALDMIDEHSVVLEQDEVRSFHDEILANITTGQSDETFLRMVFSDRAVPSTSALQNQIAKRLLNLGFAEQAGATIMGPAIGSEMAERRYLRAEIAISLGQFGRVEALLSGISTERAQNLRMQAGISVESTGFLETSGEPPNDVNWQQRNWAELSSQTDDPLLQSVATRLQSSTGLPADTETPLAASQSLIEDSSALRGEVSALLERYQAPN